LRKVNFHGTYCCGKCIIYFRIKRILWLLIGIASIWMISPEISALISSVKQCWGSAFGSGSYICFFGASRIRIRIR
jgi:hypothetical protein